MHTETFNAMASDPAVFRQAVLIDSDHGPVAFGSVCEDWQSADFEALDAAWMSVAGLDVAEPVKRRAWIERPRGHSKTSDIALQVAWVLAFSQRNLSGVVAAADADQADLLRAAVDRLVRLNPDWLGTLLTVRADRIVNPHTGSVCRIITSDAPSSFGLLVDFIVADEVTHWQRRDLWDSLLSAAAKRSHCLLVSICNAGFRDSWQWSIRESVRTDSGWVFSRLGGPVASWISATILAEQQRLLPPQAYARLWLNQYSNSAGDALDADAITASVTLAGPPSEPEPGFAYVIGLDLGLSRDASALVLLAKNVGREETIAVESDAPLLPRAFAAALDIGLIDRPADDEPTEQVVFHAPSGRLRLAHVQVWRPERGRMVQLPEVAAAVLALARRFNVALVAADVWQAQLLLQLLQQEGLPTLPVQFSQVTLPAMAQEVLSAFNDRRIELFDDADLLADLSRLRIVEKSYGLRLESPRDGRGHGDIASALSVALLAAKSIASAPGPPRIDRELIAWP